jgi:HAD superfamily hydrolase (TIGR01490 family)
MDMSTTAAFFDVDETLITEKSVFSFLEFHFHALGHPERYGPAVESLRRRAASGESRAQTNRAYYGFYAGQPVDLVAEHGYAWFTAGLASGGLFHQPVRDAFDAHRRAGDLTVLVSGSFSACLDPIAAHLGADLAFGTEPAAADGRYTGEVATSMIAGGKAAIASRVLTERGIKPATAYAYADHASDLDLLRAVGHPVAVGPDPVLLAEAERAGGWSRLPGIHEIARVD